MLTAKILLVYLLEAFSYPIIGLDHINHEQALCLAENVYFESAGEDIRGQYAVAAATLNRVKSSQFPNTICEVVKQTNKTKTACAFSWYCDRIRHGKEIPIQNKNGSINQKVLDKFHTATIVALNAMSGSVKDQTHGATHFHNLTVIPVWSQTLKRTVKIGNHYFYK